MRKLSLGATLVLAALLPANPGRANGALKVKETQIGTLPSDAASGNFTTSPDNRRVAYFAIRNDKVAVIVDKVPGPYFDDIYENGGVFSADSRRTAYVAQSKGKYRAVIDGVPGPLFDAVLIETPALDLTRPPKLLILF